MITSRKKLVNDLQVYLDDVMNNRMVSAPDLEYYLGVTKPTLYKMFKEPDFPKPLVWGKKLRRWSLKEIDEWVAKHKGGQASE